MKNALQMLPQQTMLSTEIAELCNKQHKEVMRDIRVIMEQTQSANLRFACESTTYTASTGQSYPCYRMDKETSMLVVTGYDVVARAKVVKRWMELESQQSKPLSHLDILAGSIQVLQEHNSRISQTEQEVKQLESKVETMQIDLRNGVPFGCISRSNALRTYGSGLCKDVFHDAMLALKVPTHKYVHHAEGFSTPTFAYEESYIPTAVKHFINDLEQTSKCKCYSKILNRNLKYKKVI